VKIILIFRILSKRDPRIYRRSILIKTSQKRGGSANEGEEKESQQLKENWSHLQYRARRKVEGNP
jgi:hypothetical protein